MYGEGSCMERVPCMERDHVWRGTMYGEGPCMERDHVW